MTYRRRVLKINGTDYHLVLLDTNALSEFSKHPQSLREFVTWSLGSKKYVPCFSSFSILELRQRIDVFERFKELLGMLGCFLLKGHEDLLQEEVDSYPDPSGIVPVSASFTSLGGEGGNLDQVLNTAFGAKSMRDREKYWNEARDSIVDGIASRVANFPPDGDTYGPAEERLFVEWAGFEQIGMRQPEFAKQTLKVSEQHVDMSAFPSVKATTYAVWHKFYTNRDRKWDRGDAYDIIISSAIPYMDAVITESQMADGLRKTQRVDDFIEDLEIYTLKDFRP